GHHQTVKLTGCRGALWASWHGALDRDLAPRFALQYFDGQEVHAVPLAEAAGEVFELEREIAALTRTLREGGAPTASGADGLWSVALCQAAHRSVEQGVPVAVSDFVPADADRG